MKNLSNELNKAFKRFPKLKKIYLDTSIKNIYVVFKSNFNNIKDVNVFIYSDFFNCYRDFNGFTCYKKGCLTFCDSLENAMYYMRALKNNGYQAHN